MPPSPISQPPVPDATAVIAPILDDGLGLRRQSRPLKLRPGIHVFRYLCRAPAPRPVAMIAPGSGPRGRVELLAAGPDGTVTLAEPGDMAVLSVEGEATASLTVVLPPGFPETAIDIHHERLSPEPPARSRKGPEPLRLLGHLEGLGDVSAAPGGWLGDPAGSRRLEGFAIAWPERPAGIDISYGVAFAGGRQGPMALTGGFVGSRGEARPIEAVTVALVGDLEGRLALTVEASFSVSGVQSAPGGTGGRLAPRAAGEHLTALRLAVAPRARRPLNPIAMRPALGSGQSMSRQ